MCGTHHTVIDNDDKSWTVVNLRELKRTHEAVYTAAIGQLRRQVGDVTEGVTFIPAANGLAILDAAGLDAAQLEECRKNINAFAERLSRIPSGARSVLALIVARGDKIPAHRVRRHWSGEFQIPVRVLRSIADCTAPQLRQHIEVLEHFALLHRGDEPFDGPPLYVVGNSAPGIRWGLLRDFRELDTPSRPVVRRVLCDLDFTAIDAD